MARVALVHNLIPHEMLKCGPFDRSAELDCDETITALTEALGSRGHQVIPINVDECISESLKAAQSDIVFNIAEGLKGESREAQIPALCELLGIPYTGSGVLTLALCLDKAHTKQILAFHGIPTPAFQVFITAADPVTRPLRFPMIVKLLREGSSMGLTPSSVVYDDQGLRRQLAYVIDTYSQPALVEEFIVGREFTIGLLGNGEDLRVLPIIEYAFDHPHGIVLYEPDPPVLSAMRALRKGDAEFAEWQQMFEEAPEIANHHTICPADITPSLEAQIEKAAIDAYRALGLRDWGRLEIRLGQDGRLYILELNPIAGIDPTYSLARAAGCGGMSYADMINHILDSALSRYGLLNHLRVC